jgi:hypothetical protein
MGSKASRASRSSKVQPVDGVGTVVPPPAQKQTASAPPTPLHPEGTPRASPQGEEFPDRPQDVTRSVTMTEGWMTGAMSGTLPPGPSLRDGAKADASPKNDGYPSASEVEASAPPQPVVDTEPPLKCWASEGDVTGQGLELPLEEVLKQATEAFGQIATALSSTKWDRRVQALKGITTVLKGLDMKGLRCGDGGAGGGARGLQLRDHARCFKSACLILHIVMKDKVLPVLLAAHELYRVTFEHGRAAVSEAEATSAASALFPHILAKLGELNIRLHESACDCVLFTAKQPLFGFSLVLERLADVLEGRGPPQASALRGQQKVRVHCGVMQAVEILIRNAPGRQAGEGDHTDTVSTWTPADLFPFVKSGLHADSVTGARVQQAALGLAMNVYTTLGKAALLPVLEQLTPAAKDILVSRLAEEGEDLEDIDEADGDEDCIELSGADGFCVLGVGLRPHAEPCIISKMNVTTDGEECLMDAILEDTGLVFDGKALGKKQPIKSALDEELLGLGGFLDEVELS